MLYLKVAVPSSIETSVRSGLKPRHFHGQLELTYLMPVTFKKYRNIWFAKIGGSYLKTDNHTDGYYAAAAIGIYY